MVSIVPPVARCVGELYAMITIPEAPNPFEAPPFAGCKSDVPPPPPPELTTPGLPHNPADPYAATYGP